MKKLNDDMTLLDQINKHKRQEVAAAKKRVSIEQLKISPFFKRKSNSLKAALKAVGASGIIAEYKKKSPSKGVINAHAKVVEVTKAYANAGVSGISVLTDHFYFGGSFEDLARARSANPTIPILRKDFMLDPYQIYEAKAHGADLILLIAASLSQKEILELTETAKTLDLDVLVEIHTKEELNKLNPLVDIVGINNRNLKTFAVDIENSVQLANLLPSNMVRISESGLSSVENIHYLRQAGFDGFLIGENFMKTDNPGKACHEFIEWLQK